MGQKRPISIFYVISCTAERFYDISWKQISFIIFSSKYAGLEAGDPSAYIID